MSQQPICERRIKDKSVHINRKILNDLHFDRCSFYHRPTARGQADGLRGLCASTKKKLNVKIINSLQQNLIKINFTLLLDYAKTCCRYLGMNCKKMCVIFYHYVGIRNFYFMNLPSAKRLMLLNSLPILSVWQEPNINIM